MMNWLRRGQGMPNSTIVLDVPQDILDFACISIPELRVEKENAVQIII